MRATFKVAYELEDLLKVFAVRAIVFCGEQEISYKLEHDKLDFSSIHILGEIDGEPVAAGRIRLLDGYAKLERIAVRKLFRGQKLGHRLTEFMIEEAARQGFKTCKMHAQKYLEKFYIGHGFETVGDTFQEAGIDHCLMVRK